MGKDDKISHLIIN